METPHFLPDKYPDLPGSKPVESAVKKSIREGKPGPSSKQGRVDVYLDRLEKVTTKKSGRKSEQGRPLDEDKGFHLLKNKLLNDFTIDTRDPETLDKIAEGLYESEKRIAIEQGRGAEVAQLEHAGNVVEKYKPLILEKAEIQRKTLADWLDYLQTNDAKHPMEFRYYVVRSLGKMGLLDKEKIAYSKRASATVAPFPDLNSEALGWVYRWFDENPDPSEYVPEDERTLEKKADLVKAVKAKDFSRLYAFAQIETAGKLNRESLEGGWKKYNQGSSPAALERDLKNKGTGWCTAVGSAQSQLEAGDFYVYYTKGDNGAYTEPRVAIRMEGDAVAEVRGVNERQELEPELVDIAQKQYHALPGGENYDKKASDMKQVTALARKQENGVPFTKDDLVFVYEINAPIESFGYDKDPRVKELRRGRDSKADAPIVFECAPNEIAWSEAEISENTKAYVGQLFPGIFKQLGHLEHLYTSFPEGKIRRDAVEIDANKTPQQYLVELNKQGFQVSGYAKHLVEHMSDQVAEVGQKGLAAKVKGIFGKGKGKKEPEQSEHVDLVRLTVRDLGFNQGATTDQVYAKAAEYGLELCQPEVGPQYRLQYKNQPMGEWSLIAMQQISDPAGRPSVFNLNRLEDGVWLSSSYAKPAQHWDAVNEFVFRLRK